MEVDIYLNEAVIGGFLLGFLLLLEPMERGIESNGVSEILYSY